MQLSKRGALAILSATALAGAGTTAVSASGHDRGGGHREGHGATLLRSSLAPSVPNDPALNGAAPGGLPWVLRESEATLRRDGVLRVRVRGLVIPTMGNPGPVTTVSASLYCGESTTTQGTTPTAPLSRRGDADMSGPVTVPPKCLDPTVLVHPNGMLALYIAASGFGG